MQCGSLSELVWEALFLVGTHGTAHLIGVQPSSSQNSPKVGIAKQLLALLRFQ